MTYDCGVCGSEQRVFLDSCSCPTCCGSPMKHDLQRLVLAQARTILLATATSTASSSHPASTVCTVSVPVLVRLRDDLAGSCLPGDYITCTGIADCLAESKACAQGRAVLAEVRVEALHVLHHPTPQTSFPDSSETPHLAAFGNKPGCLTALIGALKDWLQPPCCSLAMAALLLSACSTGSSAASSAPSSDALSTAQDIMETDPDSECDTLRLSTFGDSKENHRVNILLLTGGHDTLENSLRSVAHALCCHVTDSSLPGSNLLPTALDFPGVPQLASVGQLAQANSGICLLTQALGVKQGRVVGEALRTGHATVALTAGQTCAVDIYPTVWCLSAAPDLLPKQQQQASGKKFNKNSVVAPLAVLFAEKSSPQLAAQFDIIIDCASIEDTAAEAWADDYLNALVSGERGRDEEEEEEGQPVNPREAACHALQTHIATCLQLPQPVMTSSAMGLLKGYWTSMRAETAAGGTGATIPPPSLDTAAKLASAAARLFHSTEIRAFPDATLAIALCEEGLIARGWVSDLWGGSLREQMAYGRDLEECLADLFKQLCRNSKVQGWEWGAQEE